MESCSGCKLQTIVAGQQLLSCSKCTKPCGARVASSISFTNCASKIFLNNAGSLACDEASSGIPTGTFRSSCRSCKITDSDNMECYCSKADGANIYSSVRVSECVNGIENNDGQLVCVGEGSPKLETVRSVIEGGASNLPPGTYQSSCRICRLMEQGTVLSCTCHRSGGGINSVSARLADCASGSFSNHDGQLVCDPVAASDPASAAAEAPPAAPDVAAAAATAGAAVRSEL